jgi:hypothetical protein
MLSQTSIGGCVEGKKKIDNERTIVYLSTLSLPNHPPTQPTVTRLHSIRRETNISKKLYPKQ